MFSYANGQGNFLINLYGHLEVIFKNLMMAGTAQELSDAEEQLTDAKRSPVRPFPRPHPPPPIPRPSRSLHTRWAQEVEGMRSV